MKMTKSRVCGFMLALCTLAMSPASAMASSALLDTSWGGSGHVQMHMGNIGSRGTGRSVLDSSGRLIAVFPTKVGHVWRVVAFRFRTNGTQDSSWGVNGKAVTPIGFDPGMVELGADGKLVIAGFVSGINGTGANSMVVRLTANGDPDPTFGNNGVVTDDYSLLPFCPLPGPCPSRDDSVAAGAMQVDGKIVIVVATQSNVGDAHGSTLRLRMMRLNRDGSLDGTYGNATSEQSWPTVGGSGSGGWRLRIQRDGQSVLAGSGSGGMAWLERFTAGGTVDTSFGVAGVTTLQAASNGTDIADMTVDAQHRILVVGSATASAGAGPSSPSNGVIKMFAARLLPSGAPDLTFAGGGIAQYSILSGDDDARSVAIKPDGGILIAGTTYQVQKSRYMPALLQLTKDGQRDYNFGLSGEVIGETDGDIRVASVLLTAQQKFYVTGLSTGFDISFESWRFRGDSADLSITATGEAARKFSTTTLARRTQRGNATIKVAARNKGPQPAGGMRIVHTFAPGTTFIRSSFPCTSVRRSGRLVVTCRRATLGSSHRFSSWIVVRPPAGMSSVIDNVTIRSRRPDAVRRNNRIAIRAHVG